MNRLKALWLLGWHFFLHWLRKLTFLYDRGGIKRFRGNFDREGLVPLDEQERELLPRWQACIGCGLCEAVCPDLRAIPDGRHTGPAYLAHSAVRDLSEARMAIHAAELLARCQDGCRDCEDICPTGVPLAELARFLIRVGDEAQAAAQK